MSARPALKQNSKSPALSILTAGLLALGMGAVSAHAATVTSSALAAAVPTAAGDGLNAAYYNTSGGLSDNTAADSYINSHAATAAFHSSQPRYNSDTAHGLSNNSVVDSTTLGTFLGGDALTLPTAYRGYSLDTSIFRYTGYIKITPDMDTQAGNGTIDVKFRGWSDDGMRLKIGGVTIDAYNAPRAYGYSDGVASFSQAGLYAIDFLYWENYGNTGVNLQWQTGSANSYQTVGSSYLYSALPVAVADSQVSEPGGLALTALGLLGLTRIHRRRPGKGL